MTKESVERVTENTSLDQLTYLGIITPSVRYGTVVPLPFVDPYPGDLFLDRFQGLLGKMHGRKGRVMMMVISSSPKQPASLTYSRAIQACF